MAKKSTGEKFHDDAPEQPGTIVSKETFFPDSPELREALDNVPSQAKAVVVSTVNPEDQSGKLHVSSMEELPEWMNAGGSGEFLTNIPGDTDAARQLRFEATLGACILLDDVLGEELLIRYFYLHPAEKIDATTGELIQLVRIVLIDTEGKLYETFSTGVRKSIALMCGHMTKGPWMEGLRVRTEAVRTGRGFKMLVLRPIFGGKS